VNAGVQVHSSSAKAFATLARNLCKLAGRTFRFYQADAALKGLRELRRGSLIINLPQGTGKTFVSQILAYAYLRDNPRSKVLVVAPTKELREQFVQMAEWMGFLRPRMVVLNFREPLSDSYQQARGMVERADLLVTTPELFANRLPWFSQESLVRLSLCVLDEIDLWPVEDFGEEDGVRYHRAFAELKSRLVANKTRFLGLTASPLGWRGSELLLKDLRCRELHPFHPSIVEYLPYVRIEPIPCVDLDVIARDGDISEKSSKLLRRLSQELGSDVLETHANDFWLFIKELANGSWGPSAANLARAILNNERERVQLFEDTLPPFGNVKIRRAARLAARARPSVLYCSQIQLVNRLASEAWPSRTAIAHSELGDRYLEEILTFKDGVRDVLIMTRDLGKRGIDFPMASSLVLFSPKSSWHTMDQELCRTRGQRRSKKIKRVYVLFYQETYEEEKLRRVLVELVETRMYETFWKFTLSPRWRRWLRTRSGLTLPEYLRGSGRNTA